MEVDDAHISVRFKFGIHTIFLFVDTLAPFSTITLELFTVLRERYPDGLTKSTASPDKTPIPESPRAVYGVLVAPNDATQGWKRLKMGKQEEYTPSQCGLKDNSEVAFAILESRGDEHEDKDKDDVEFEVEWPSFDDEVYE